MTDKDGSEKGLRTGMVTKIDSGGQTGADRGRLDVAVDLWIPRINAEARR